MLQLIKYTLFLFKTEELNCTLQEIIENFQKYFWFSLKSFSCGIMKMVLFWKFTGHMKIKAELKNNEITPCIKKIIKEKVLL